MLWAKAETRETLVSDFVAIAILLGLPEKDAQDQSIAVAAVKRWLDSNANWLLILDNADDLKLAHEFLPSPGKGQVLLTTRARSTGGVAERIEIADMKPHEGALFLLRRANIIAKEAQLEAASPANRAKAEELSTALGGLPLALDQAGAYIEETPSSLAEYLALYKQEGAKLLAQRGDLPLDNHASVTITFSLAFQKVEATSPAAADLIRACAFLAPDAIPEEIFTDGGGELGENLKAVVTSGTDFLDALKEAGRFSLLDRNPDDQTLDIHRLVQQVVKDAMDQATQRLWAERVVRAVSAAFPAPDDVTNWPECERLLPHTQVCAVLIHTWKLETEEVALLLNQIGYYLDERARYAQAEPFYRHALAIRQRVLGPDHPNTAQSLNSLAALYDTQGLYAQAEPLYQRALAICEQRLGSTHPHTATTLNNLALLYDNQGRYAQAELLYRRALKIREQVFLGLDHPDTATSLNNLAEFYRRQRLYAKAEPLYQRALEIMEKILPDHPNTATFLENYAILLRQTTRETEAEKLEARARAIREKQERGKWRVESGEWRMENKT